MEGANAALAAAVAAAGTASCRLLISHGDRAVRVEKCSQEGQGIRTTGHQWPMCCLPDQGKAGFLGYKWHQGHPFQGWSWTDSALGKCGLCCVLLS